MRPGRSLIILLSLWALLGLWADGQAVYSSNTGAATLVLRGAWLVTGVLIAAVCLFAAIQVLSRARILPSATREVPDFLSLGVPSEITVSLHSRWSGAQKLTVFDGVPASFVVEKGPQFLPLLPNRTSQLIYPATPLERGDQQFADIHIELHSPFGLWLVRRKLPCPSRVRVLPNFVPVLQFSLLAMTNQATQLGIRNLNKPGQSREFRQLRDFLEGDSLNQVDWKATSRRCQLISREYQEQRDQQILLVLDCGRRLALRDGELTQFDHSLNAMILLSQVALDQGDAVGVMAMGDEPRYLRPMKGSSAMKSILNHVHSWQSLDEPADFAEAARVILAHQNKRALIIFLTNLRTEDHGQMIAPLATLRRKHALLVATLRENALTKHVTTPAGNLEEATTAAAAQLYVEERQMIMARLEAARIRTLDCTAQELPLRLSNRYLELKKSGRV